ncbi:FAD-dependent monooxygenase [Melittangium boletus]|nr:FAD-dependent monooxygenase [Melittangium boletus]
MVEQRIIVIGGGIGGLCAAIALRKAGCEVVLYERAGELRQVGAGLSLLPNAFRALETLGLAREVAAVGKPWRETRIHRSDGRVLGHLPVEPLCRTLGQSAVVMSRAELHEVLLRALGPDVPRLGARCTGFRVEGTGVVAEFEDGRRERGACLIGADGLNSIIRGQVVPGVTQRYSGHSSWRGMVEFESPVFPEGTLFEVLGRGARFVLCHIGPGASGAKRVYWALLANTPAGGRDPEGGRKASVLSRVGGWMAPIEAVVEATPEEAILRTDVSCIDPLDRWGEGPVTLLGDAAHAMVTDMAQGACQAIEDAVVLAQCVREADDLERALRAYEARRRPRTAELARLSWRSGSLRYVEGRVSTWLRDTLLRCVPSSLVEKQLRYVVGFPFLDAQAGPGSTPFRAESWLKR